MNLTPDSLSFLLLSFEGPDRYSQAGGLGVRVWNLARSLAHRGYDTHLLFVGDPDSQSIEELSGGSLTLHRWCQWISRHHPEGVYAGEEGKLYDFNESVPPFAVEFVRSRLEAGKIPVILAEEWHTAEALIRLHGMLDRAGLRGRAVVFWNANNTMSFHRVDWPRLADAAQITTVSRYMKHLMWRIGVNPIVIPNGIPGDLLESVDEEYVRALKDLFDPTGDAVVLFKVGRFDPAKRWMMAAEAAAGLKSRGIPLSFPLSGGIEAHGREFFARAHELGLKIIDINGRPESGEDLISLLRAAPRGDIYNMRFFLTQEMLRPFYRAADAVLANSGHEPFGLVGLEAMAAGGLVFTGATGEEYAFGGRCAVALDTDSPEEILTHVLALKNAPERAGSMRVAARAQASEFVWDNVIDMLLDKVSFAAQVKGLVGSRATHEPVGKVRDVLIYTVVHQPQRLRLPARSLPEGASPRDMAEVIFDDAMNERYFRKVARTCYYPALDRFRSLVDRGFKMAIGFSLSFIEQAERWDPRLIKEFKRLVAHPNVELVNVEPTHGFALLWDIRLFIERMKWSADRLEEVFGVRPVVSDTTELMMSDTIYHALDSAGFKAAFADGRPWVMDWRESTYVYHHGRGRMKLLTRHYPLSDDVGYRFSNRGWSEWPLMADRYASWLADCPGDVVVLGWDFETFGEHHRADSGIFDFLSALPQEVERAGLGFATPSEILEKYGSTSFELPLPEFASTWAGSGGLEFFLGNDAQRAVFQLMMQTHQKALLTGNPELIELALRLSQSDNLHLIQWFGRSGSEAEVSSYFTPREWWELTPGGIIWEIQQVYKQVISAMDAYLGGESALRRLAKPIRSKTVSLAGGQHQDAGIPAPEPLAQTFSSESAGKRGRTARKTARSAAGFTR